MGKKTVYTIYKILYGRPDGTEFVAYLGRTKQTINSRLRGHFFKLPMHKLIDIFSVTHIETATCQTEADMFLYEIYYINRFKPALNRDDKAGDELTISLPELEFSLYSCGLLDKWQGELMPQKEIENGKDWWTD